MFPRWLTFITESDGRTLNETNGVVSSSNARTPLDPTADVGDLKIGWERDNDFLGIIRNFSFPVSLYRTAAKIARNEFYKKNIERRLFFVLAKLTLIYDQTINPAPYSRAYKPLYRGEVDLTTVKDGDFKITFNLLDGGTAQQLKAKKDTVYEISMDDPDAITVKMDGMPLYDTVNFAVTNLSIPTSTPQHYIPITMVNRDGSAAGFAGLQQTGGAIEDPTTSDKYLFQTDQVITGMRIKGQLKVKIDFNTASATGGYVAMIISNLRPGTSSGNVVAYITPNGSSGEPAVSQTNTLTIDFDQAIDAGAGENFFITAQPKAGSPALVGIEYLETTFTISFSSSYKATYIKAFLPETINKRLVKYMTGSEEKTSSTLISQNNNLALSCINAVRGLTKPAIKTTPASFYKFCHVQMVAAVGVENDKIVIENIDHFYNTNEVEDLGKVSGLEITVAKEKLANTFVVGYEEQSYDNVNGRYEFNNSHLYESQITRAVQKYELICPYRADPFGIEILRTNLDGKTTTDNDSDNDVCILDIDLANPQQDPDIGTYYNLRRIVYDNFNDPDDFGVPAPDKLFNVELRPEMVLRKHSRWINSMMYGFEGDKLVYRTTEKNTIKTKLGSTVIDGKADFPITSDMTFIPRLLSFDTDIDPDILLRMQANPNRAFKITDTDETTYTGFIERVGVEPDTLKEQPFTLLSTPDNNFLNRIK